MPRKHLIISGEVQGVGFRYFTMREAQRHGITGWVRNRPAGTVEIEAQGNDKRLQSFIEAVRRGPAYSEVEDTEVKLLPEVEQESGFYIRR